MARVTRIALDLALVSLRKVGPVVSRMWSSTKSYLIKTPAKPLLCNPVFRKAESAVDAMSELIMSKIASLRDSLLPREQKYLEKELEKVKKRMDGQNKSASKSLKPNIETAWQYAKIEMAPPMSQNFLHGPGGKRLEESVAKSANNFIMGLENKIKAMDAIAESERKRKEVEAKAALELRKAEAKIKMEAEKKEAEKLAVEAKKAAEIEKKEKAAKEADEQAKKKAEATKAAQEKPKAEKKPAEKKPPKKEPAKRKPAKKNRRDNDKKSPKPKS